MILGRIIKCLIWFTIIASLIVACQDSSEITSNDGDIDTKETWDDDSSGADSDNERTEDNFCIPTTLICIDNNVATCNATGTSYQFITDCSVIGICIEGECHPDENPTDGDADLVDQDFGDIEKTDVDVEENIPPDGDVAEILEVEDYDEESDGDEDIEYDIQDPCFDDAYAGNDGPVNAQFLTLPFSASNLSLCPWDTDWFKMPMSESAGVRISTEFLDSNGDIDISLYEEGNYASSNYIAASISRKDKETIVYNALEAGVYYLGVSIRNDANIYSLNIEYDSSGFLIEGNNCASPLIIDDLGEQTSHNTIGLSNDFFASCGFCSGSDAVYQFTVDSPKSFDIRVYSSFDAVLHVRSDCTDLLTEIICEDGVFGGQSEILHTGILQPGNYYIIIDGDRLDDQGYYRLQITED